MKAQCIHQNSGLCETCFAYRQRIADLIQAIEVTQKLLKSIVWERVHIVGLGKELQDTLVVLEQSKYGGPLKPTMEDLQMVMGNPMGEPDQITGKETGDPGQLGMTGIGDKYVISAEDDLRLRTSFVYRAPMGNQPERYKLLRDQARILARLILGQVPPSRERSLALTHVEEAVMWANSGIAQNE